MNKTKDYYVYLHKKKTTGEVFYVGKGSTNRAYSKFGRSSWWNRVVNKYGYFVEIVTSGLQEWYALELEMELISYYGRINTESGTLINLTDGGDAGPNRVVSQETKDKLSIAMADKEIHKFTHKDGTCFTGTRLELKEKFHFDPKPLFRKTRKVTTHNGWTLSESFPALHAASDKNEYKFVHETGEVFVGTRSTFKLKFNIDPKELFKKKIKNSTFGWSLDYYKEPKNKKDNNNYKFTNKQGEVFIGTRSEFRNKYNINPNPLFSYKSFKNWTILDQYPKRLSTYDKNIYKFIHKNGEVFTGMRIELQDKYEIDICELFSGRGAKSCHGWRLAP